MRTHPYIGITGITTRAEADELVAMIRKLGLPGDYLLMQGVLASYRGLAFGELADPHQYVSVDQLDEVMIRDVRLLNLVHYNSSASGLPRQLTDLARRVTWADGVQLNITWPAPQQLYRYRWLAYTPVVLQISREAYERVGSVRALIGKLQAYQGMVEYVLLDLSGGIGQPFDLDFTQETLKALVESGLSVRWAVSGGLGPKTVERLESLLEIYPALSWDAQAALRTADRSALDLQKCWDYLDASCRLLRLHTA